MAVRRLTKTCGRLLPGRMPAVKRVKRIFPGSFSPGDAMNPPLPPHSPRLSPLLIQLLRGVIDRDEQPALWQDLLQHQSAATEYFRLIGLELRLDEAEGYAFLKQFLVDEEGTPRLIQRRP